MNIPVTMAVSASLFGAGLIAQRSAAPETPGEFPWRTDLAAAMEESQRSQRPIVAVFR